MIAEISSNWNDLDDCKESIFLAKKCGAWAVKFQSFSSQEMFGYGDTDPNLSDYDIHELAECAAANNIEFGCTFFTPKRLKQNAHLLSFIKIASSNMMDSRLIETALATDLPVFISDGGHNAEERNAIKEIYPSLQFLYCVSSYPSYYNNYRDVDFDYCGVSDHSLEVFPNYHPDWQIAEKHVNLVSAENTDDYMFNLFDEHNFALYCAFLSGNKIKRPIYKESEMRTNWNVRLVAIKDIARGEKFKLGENYDVHRCVEWEPNYLSAVKPSKIHGKSAKEDIKAFHAIRTDQV